MRASAGVAVEAEDPAAEPRIRRAVVGVEEPATVEGQADGAGRREVVARKRGGAVLVDAEDRAQRRHAHVGSAAGRIDGQIGRRPRELSHRDVDRERVRRVARLHVHAAIDLRERVGQRLDEVDAQHRVATRSLEPAPGTMPPRNAITLSVSLGWWSGMTAVPTTRIARIR